MHTATPRVPLQGFVTLFHVIPLVRLEFAIEGSLPSSRNPGNPAFLIHAVSPYPANILLDRQHRRTIYYLGKPFVGCRLGAAAGAELYCFPFWGYPASVLPSYFLQETRRGSRQSLQDLSPAGAWRAWVLCPYQIRMHGLKPRAGVRAGSRKTAAGREIPTSVKPKPGNKAFGEVEFAVETENPSRQRLFGVPIRKTGNPANRSPKRWQSVVCPVLASLVDA